jgi:hypothetical protein
VTVPDDADPVGMLNAKTMGLHWTGLATFIMYMSANPPDCCTPEFCSACPEHVVVAVQIVPSGASETT